MSYRDYLMKEEALRRSPSRFKRAAERTRTADLISLRVSGQWLPTVAHGCQSSISKVFSLARLLCCTVLRTRLCQGGINNA